MTIPSTTLSLTSSAPPGAVQSVANRIHVIGPCSAGPLNTPRAKNKLADLTVNGYGPGVSLAAEVFAEASSNLKETGLPVFFTRSATSTPSTRGTMTKVPADAGTELAAYGRIRLAGADENGDLFWQSVVSGVSLQVQTGMALAHTINGRAILLTIPAATAASAVETYWNGQAALTALATIDAFGTGASNAGTTLAQRAFDKGSLGFTPLDNGYSVVMSYSGLSTPLSASFAGVGNKELTILLQTDGDGEPISTAQDVLDEIAPLIVGKISARILGDGTGLSGSKTLTALTFGSTAAATSSGTPTDRYLLQVRVARGGALGAATVQFAADEINPEDRVKFGVGNASMFFLAKRSGLSVAFTQQTGASKALSHTFVDGLLTIALGTDGSSQPASTPVDVRTYLQGFPQLLAAFRFNLEVGDGSEVMIAADAVDLPAPSLNWSPELLVPASGIVPLTDSRLATGVTLTFTGTLALGDLWHLETTLPASSIADMRTALAAVLADDINIGGCVVFASALDQAAALLLDTDIQAALQSRQLVAIFTTRGIGEGVNDETHGQWQDAQVVEWLGFTSSRGLLSKCAGEYLHADSYTGRNMRRYALFAAAGRKASAPYHQDLGRTLEIPGSGRIRRCLGLYHDEDKTPGLHDRDFITLRSAIERPGAKYITAAPTCADPNSDAGYSLLSYPSLMLVGLRTAKLRAFDLRNTMFSVAQEADSTGAPAGALTPASAISIEQYLGAGIEAEWRRPKSDGQGSIGPLPEGVKVCEVLRINNFASGPDARRIYFRINAPALVPAQYINIEGNILLPS